MRPDLSKPFWAVTLFPLALCLTLAWVVTGTLDLPKAALLFAGGLLLQLGARLLRDRLPFVLGPLLFVAGYGLLRGTLDWPLIWPFVLLVSVAAGLALFVPAPSSATSEAPCAGHLAQIFPLFAYLALAIGGLWGGMPVWTLLGLLTLPLAWHYMRAACPLSLLLHLYTALFLLVFAGYLIQGLVP